MRKKEKMSPGFALFNCHVNRAKDRAIASFIRKFGYDTFRKKLEPFLDKGIMSIFDEKPNKHTKFFVQRITRFVNA